MSKLKTNCQRKRKANNRFAGYSGHCFTKRCKNYNCRVCEYRNRNKPSGNCQSPFLVFLSNKFDKAVRHFFSSAGFFQDTAHHNAKANDNTSAFQCVSETFLNGSNQTSLCCAVSEGYV